MRFPLDLTDKLKRKAIEIANSGKCENKIESDYISVPHLGKARGIDRFLLKAGIQVAYGLGTNIKDLVKPKVKKDVNVQSVIYKILRNGCSMAYCDELSGYHYNSCKM